MIVQTETLMKKNIQKKFYLYIQTVCRPGYYGTGCGQLCTGFCMINGVCNHVDGVCLAGC